MRIRKSICEITLEDLNAYPAWQFALDEEGLDGQDETTVRPYVGPVPIDPAQGGIVIRCTFKLSDGTILRGHISPQPAAVEDIAYLHPVIVLGDCQIGIWHGAQRLTRADIDQYIKKLGRRSADIFPLECTSDVAFVGGPVKGVIAGFKFLERESDGSISDRIVTLT